MKDNEWQVVNRQLSKALKKAGFKQEGIFWWVFQGNEWKLRSAEWLHNWIGGQELDICIADLIKCGTVVTAPTCAEMGKALPNWNYTIRLDYEPYKNKWCALQKGGKIEVDADTEANARAKMYLYLKKEGLL